MKQYLAAGQKVIVVNAEGKHVHGTIVQVFSEEAAKIEHDNGTFIAVLSEDRKPGTFHFEQASPKEEHKKPEAHNQHKKE